MANKLAWITDEMNALQEQGSEKYHSHHRLGVRRVA